jgi:hypothetical protein
MADLYSSDFKQAVTCRCGAEPKWEFEKSPPGGAWVCPNCYAMARSTFEWDSQMVPVLELKARVAELEHEMARTLRALRMDDL